MPNIRTVRPANLAGAIHRFGRSLSRVAGPFSPLVSWAYLGLGWLSVRPPFLRSIRLHDYVMRVSILDCSVSHALLTERVWEPLTTRLFQRLCRPGMVVVDVGAQLGYYTLLAARLVGRQGRVVAFEPDKRHLQPLQASISLNGLQNVTVAPYAVAGSTGRIPLKVNVAAPTRALQSIRLDDYFRTGERVDFIKMDIDGGEPEALNGMKDVVAGSPGVLLLVEYDRWQHETAGRSPQAFLDQLQEIGLELALVIDEEAGTAEAMSWNQVSELRRSVNLLLHRKADVPPTRLDLTFAEEAGSFGAS